MWFKNLHIYRLPKPWAIDPARLEEQLSTLTLQGCSATDAQSFGWVPPRDGGSLVHSVNNQLLLALGVEQKLLPASVVNQFAKDKAKEIAEAEGRKIGRKEMREIREQTTLELLPRAFVRRRTTWGWIDPANGWLVVDAAAVGKAEEFLEHLRKSVEGMPARLLKVNQSPAAAMTGWVAVPPSFPEVKKEGDWSYAVLANNNVVEPGQDGWVAINPKFFSELSGLNVATPADNNAERWVMKPEGKSVPKDKAGWINFWTDMGTPADYLQLHEDILLKKRLPGFSAGDGGSPFYLGKDAVLGAGVSLQEWVSIGHGATIGEGASLTRVVVWDGARVAPGSIVTDSIIIGGD